MPGTFPSMEGHLLPTLSPLLRDMDLRPVMALPNQKKACFGMGEPSFLIHLQTEPAAGKSGNAHIVHERSLSRDGRAPFFTSPDGTSRVLVRPNLKSTRTKSL